MRGAVLLLLATANCAAQSLADFAGTWMHKYQGRIFLVLRLNVEGAALAGSVVHPKRFSMDQDGDFTRIASARATFILKQLALTGSRLEFVFDGDRYGMTLVDRDHAMLLPLDEDYPFPPWKLERSADANAAIAASWPVPRYMAEIVALQKRLKAMVQADQKERLAKKISDAKLEAIDRGHLAEVLRIHEKYGWPLVSVVGREASHDYWLLVQHQDLEVQRKILPDLERAANRGEASKSDFAYLYDRVQVRLGKPQRWGTQTTCKEGKPLMDPVEDPAGLDRRRKELAMMPIERYMKMDYLVRMCAQPAEK